MDHGLCCERLRVRPCCVDLPSIGAMVAFIAGVAWAAFWKGKLKQSTPDLVMGVRLLILAICPERGILKVRFGWEGRNFLVRPFCCTGRKQMVQSARAYPREALQAKL